MRDLIKLFLAVRLKRRKESFLKKEHRKVEGKLSLIQGHIDNLWDHLTKIDPIKDAEKFKEYVGALSKLRTVEVALQSIVDYNRRVLNFKDKVLEL